MVVFEDGLPRKSEYRRFVIKGVDGQNDVASMHEVITRRFRRLLDEQAALDRGRRRDDGPDARRPRDRPAAQVRLRTGPGRRRRRPAAGRGRPARRSTSSASTTSPCAGWPSGWRRCGCPTEEDPVILPRTSEGLYLLQRVRDEAHRFAITHHRSRRSQVDGREPARRRARAWARCAARRCCKHFGSLQEAARGRRSTRSPQVPGIGQRTADGDQGCGRRERRRDRKTVTGDGQHRRPARSSE